MYPETVRSDDTFVVSYPKSGNTWQRFLIANLVRPDERISFLNINRIVPDVYQTPEEELANHPSPRILKSHDAFTLRFPQVDLHQSGPSERRGFHVPLPGGAWQTSAR